MSKLDLFSKIRSYIQTLYLNILGCYSDMDLPKEELQDVIFKVERVMKKVDYQSVPPIIYHLILLVKGKLPGRVLQVVIDYFNKQEHKLSKEKNQNDNEVNSMEINSEEIGKACSV